MTNLTLEIITPEKIVLQEEGIDFVNVEFLESEKKGRSEIGIMKGHAPMLMQLSVAPIRYEKNGNANYVVVAGGFLEIKDNKITVISAGAELVQKEPDVEPAITARKRVESWMEGGVGKVEFDEKKAEADITRSSINLYKASSGEQ
ncbi:MAG: F0F1 ATP synthase subunit epsilon [bacterium]